MTIEEWMWAVYTSKGGAPVLGLATGAMALSVIRVVFGSLVSISVEHDLPGNSKAAEYNKRIGALKPLGAVLTALSVANLSFNVFAYTRVDTDSKLPPAEFWVVWVALPLTILTIGVAIWFGVCDAKASRLKDEVDRLRKPKK